MYVSNKPKWFELSVKYFMLESKYNIKLSESIAGGLNNLRIDDVLKIASYEDEEGTKHIDLRTGELKDITDIELMIAEFKDYDNSTTFTLDNVPIMEPESFKKLASKISDALNDKYSRTGLTW